MALTAGLPPSSCAPELLVHQDADRGGRAVGQELYPARPAAVRWPHACPLCRALFLCALPPAPGTLLFAFLARLCSLPACFQWGKKWPKSTSFPSCVKTEVPGTSLEVQWFTFRLPNAGLQVTSLVGELRSHMSSSQRTKT